MLSTISQTFQPTYTFPVKLSLLHKFVAWTESQDDSRLLWLGISLIGHGCFLTPLTVAIVMLSGMNFILFMSAFSAMAMTLVVNLAALPTKITLPVLGLSILIHLTAIICALTMGFIA